MLFKNIRRSLAVGAITAALVACAGGPNARSTGEVVDDATITSRIKTSMVASKEVEAREIQVETYNGVVQLSGFADNQQEITRAGEIARSTPGVKSVKNDIRIKSTSAGK
jgi:hyperosmotically inducible periplasmic protein